MNKFTIGLLLIVFFLLGACGTMIARDFFVPPAMAGVDVQKWEYFCIDENTPADIREKANQAGQEGWEMVAGGGAGGAARVYLWCFKRPSGSTTSAPSESIH